MPSPDEALANQLLGLSGSVGDVDVTPYYPGGNNRGVARGAVGVNVAPRYVGVPVNMVQQGSLQTPVNVGPTTYSAADTTWFGLGATSIPAGSTGTQVPLRPLRPFTPQREYHPSTIQDLLINEAQIGGTNIFSNVAGVPVELFSEVSTAPQIDWPTLETAVGIIFVVQNPTLAALVFKGGLYGTAARR